jgi:hypothetical protein
MAEVLKTTFLTVIQNELFRGAEFLKYATSHDAYVKDKSVEIPQAGTIPAVQIDEGDVTLPLPMARRTDGKRSYNLKNFRSLPIVIENSEELETSYNKAASVIKQEIDQLNQSIGDYGAWDWSIDPTEFSANILRTTGTVSANALVGSVMTGTRKSLLIADLSKAMAKLKSDNVPENNKFYCLMPANVYYDFLDANSNVLNADYMNKGNLEEGMVAKVHGWHIFTRADTSRYNVGATAKNAFGAAELVDDNAAIICWNESTVARALGSVKVFSDIGKSDLQGDSYSAMVRFRNTILRNDGKGVVTIVQSS